MTLNRNIWRNHEVASKPHITVIIPQRFSKSPAVGGLNVKILVLATPSGDRLELSVVEDTRECLIGFLDFDKVTLRSCLVQSLHSEFTQENERRMQITRFEYKM
ncbi:hypothetical protein GBAR_LOCUS6929 [Geodia barretti]|uniref:Uncharacterized protein n=1 Tax=Geodia barretti TaxID=519541 RepID=A0AA35RFF7_GEOBA|nr:hypothetical protein GBAR_LOCUS6929 [Geodia barretti]